jgi:hypothetical protein
MTNLNTTFNFVVRTYLNQAALQLSALILRVITKHPGLQKFKMYLDIFKYAKILNLEANLKFNLN